MKIKRFEAGNMSEALRMIKKEFGEEAVILSAKTMKRSGRLLGLGAGSQVVVTAAIDHEAVQRSGETGAETVNKTANGLRGAPPRPAERPGAGIGRILQQFTPITRTGFQKLQPKIVQRMNESQQPSDNMPAGERHRSVYEELLDQGLARSVAVELADKLAELAPPPQGDDEETVSVLAQIIEAKGWIAPRHLKMDPRTIVVVGPCGAGKTTTIAKMAARAVMQERPGVGIISLDDQRIAGTAELEKYADILGVPFIRAEDETGLHQALRHFRSLELVLLDTPGLSPDDISRREALADTFRLLPGSEIHLLINTGAREDVIIKTINFFRPLGINRLLPTHIDWCRQIGPVISQVALNRMPVGYMGTGAQVPEGIELPTAHSLAAMLLSQEDEKKGRGEDDAVTIIQRRAAGSHHDQYVANRNSDIFHHQQCKAVSRINGENILIFKDSDEAMDQGFKPCRMCCMSLFVPKPIDRPARGRVAGIRN